jgi:hypothetical protein
MPSFAIWHILRFDMGYAMRALSDKAVVVIILATMCGCLSDRQNALVNGQIKVGMERAKVTAYLGPPQRTETYGATEFLFYSPPVLATLAAVPYNPVAITDGRVAGLGMIYYQSFPRTNAN